jgi:RNA-directed DNA polymerase
LTALALARAMLAGPPSARGLAARMRAGIAADAPWCTELAERCARIPPERWRRLTTRSLADLVEHDSHYSAAWRSQNPPVARRYILRERSSMGRPPLGLERCSMPYWPHCGALADTLGLSIGALWRLTLPSGRQRRAFLGDQHYAFRLMAKRSGGWRLLEVPHPYLKALQRRILDGLLDRVPPHEAAFGFARERSVLAHARLHAGQPVVLKFDLQDFFGAVRASRVHALFATLGYHEEVARSLTALCTTATPEPVLARLHEEGGLSFEQVQRLRDPHLPQGAPTTPQTQEITSSSCVGLRCTGRCRSLT